jgi:hypothetical protein
MLDIASDLDSATGGFRKVLPSISVLTREGSRILGDAEIRPYVDRVLNG